MKRKDDSWLHTCPGSTFPRTTKDKTRKAGEENRRKRETTDRQLVRRAVEMSRERRQEEREKGKVVRGNERGRGERKGTERGRGIGGMESMEARTMILSHSLAEPRLVVTAVHRRVVCDEQDIFAEVLGGQAAAG